MKKSGFTEGQIAFALRQAETSTKVSEDASHLYELLFVARVIGSHTAYLVMRRITGCSRLWVVFL